MKAIRCLSLLLAALSLTAACATEDAARTGTSIPSLIGDAACDSDAQCRTIGVGAKACGGPDAYLAWSTKRTDEDALQALVERQAEARRKAISDKGMMSNCAFVADPGAYCEPRAGASGVCRLRSGGAGGNLVR
jgi:hypothetical protein